MDGYSYIDAPKQWVNLLKRHPEFTPSGEPALPVALNEQTHDDLVSVHRAVCKLPYKRDADLHGQWDFWQPADARGGDCEDLALARWRMLVERGWSADSLSLCLCQSSAGYHAVLLVCTDQGFIVLDNWMWLPAAMPDLTRDLSYGNGYQWLSRSDPRNRWIVCTEGRGLEETQVMNAQIRVLNRQWNERLAA